MEGDQFLQAMKSFEQQLSDVVEHLDSTRDNLAMLLEGEMSNHNVKDLMDTLHTDIMQLREVCQKFVLNNALLLQGDSGDWR